MTQLVEIRANKQQLKNVERLLQAYPKGGVKVAQRAVNKVAVSARADIVRTVREDINIKAGELKRRNVSLKKANRSTLQAQIDVTGRRIPLSYFSARQTRRGITYTLKRSEGRQRIATGFFRTDKKGVWKRLEESRLPITQLHGPSIPLVVDTIPKLTAGVYENKLTAQLAAEINRQVTVLLERGK